MNAKEIIDKYKNGGNSSTSNSGTNSSSGNSRSSSSTVAKDIINAYKSGNPYKPVEQAPVTPETVKTPQSFESGLVPVETPYDPNKKSASNTPTISQETQRKGYEARGGSTRHQATLQDDIPGKITDLQNQRAVAHAQGNVEKVKSINSAIDTLRTQGRQQYQEGVQSGTLQSTEELAKRKSALNKELIGLGTDVLADEEQQAVADARIKEIKSEIAKIDEQQKKYSSLVDKGLLAFGAAEQGAGQVVSSVSNFADMVFGGVAQEIHTLFQSTLDTLGIDIDLGEKNAVSKYNDWVNKTNEEEAQYFATNASTSKAAQNVNQYGTTVAAAVPMAVVAVMTAGGSELTTAGLEAYSSAMQASNKFSQMAQAISYGAQKMMQDPNWQLSFAQESGNAYKEALADGASDTEAALYATLYGWYASTIEVGGLSEVAGMQSLPDEVAEALKNKENSKIVMDYVRSIIDEAKEENLQGIVQESFKAAYGKDVGLYGTATEGDDKAYVIDPNRMKEEATGAAVVSAILGGGQVINGIAANARNGNANVNTQQEVQQNEPVSEVPVEPTAEPQVVTEENVNAPVAEPASPAEQTIEALIGTKATNSQVRAIIDNVDGIGDVFHAMFPEVDTENGTASQIRNRIKDALLGEDYGEQPSTENANISPSEQSSVNTGENASLETENKANTASDELNSAPKAEATEQTQNKGEWDGEDIFELQNRRDKLEDIAEKKRAVLESDNPPEIEVKRSAERQANIEKLNAEIDRYYEWLEGQESSPRNTSENVNSTTQTEETTNGNVNPQTNQTEQQQETTDGNVNSDTAQEETTTADVNTTGKRTNNSASPSYQEAVDTYGAIPQSNVAGRDAVTPKSIDGKTYVSETAQRVQESQATPEERIPEIQNAIMEEMGSFVGKNETVLFNDSKRRIESEGIGSFRTNWQQAVREGKSSSDLVADGAALLQALGNDPKVSANDYLDAVNDYIQLMHNAGQTIAAGRIINRLTPQGKVIQMQKTVDKLNASRNGENSPNKNKAEKAHIARVKQKSATEEAVKVATEATESFVNDVKSAETDTPTETAVEVKNAVEEALQATGKATYTYEYDGDTTFSNISDVRVQAAKEISKQIERIAKGSNKRIPTNFEILTREIGRIIKERIPSEPKGNSAKTTPYDTLRAISENQALMNEVNEIVQSELRTNYNSEVNNASEGDYSRAEEVYDSIVNEGINFGTSDIVEQAVSRTVAKSAVATEESKSVIREQIALGVSPETIAERIANDAIEKSGIDGQLAELVRSSAAEYVNEVSENSALEADAIVSRIVRMVGESYTSLAKADRADKVGVRDLISADLAVSLGIDQKTASDISNRVGEIFDAKLQERMSEILKSRYGVKENSRSARTFMERFTEAVNLGTFTSEYAAQATADLFKVKAKDITLNPALIEEYLNQTTDDGRNDVLDRIMQDIADQTPATTSEMINSLRYLNMLGNFKTQGRNVIGNFSMGVTAASKRRMEAGIQQLAQKVSGGKYQATLSAKYGRDMYNVAKEWYKSDKGVRQATLGEKKYGTVSDQNYTREIQDKRAKFNFGAFSERSKIAKGIETGLNAYSKATSWAMEKGDEIFTQFHFCDALCMYLQNAGISASDFQSMIDSGNIADQVILNEAMNYAVKEAQEATFRDSNKISDFAQNFDANWGKVPKTLSRGILAFRKTPADVAVRMEEYSPIGAINAMVKAAQAVRGEATVSDVINSASKSLTGTAIALLGLVAANAGIVHIPDDDDKQESFNKLRGIQDYSIDIAGKNITLDWLSPVSAPFFIGAMANELFEGGDITGDELVSFFGSISDEMIGMSMLSSLRDALKVTSSYNGDSNLLPMFLMNAVGSYLTQIATNSIIGQAEQAYHKTRQTYYSDSNGKIPTEAQKTIARATQKIPGIDYNTEEYIDAWGRTQSNGSLIGRIGNSFFNPSYVSDDRSTEVDDELERIYTKLKDVGENPNVYPTTKSWGDVKINGKRVERDEYHQFKIDSGAYKLELVSDLMNSDGYDSLTDSTKSEVIGKLYGYANYLATKNIADERGESYSNSTYDKLEGYSLSDVADYYISKEYLNSKMDSIGSAFETGKKDAVISALLHLDSSSIDSNEMKKKVTAESKEAYMSGDMTKDDVIDILVNGSKYMTESSAEKEIAKWDSEIAKNKANSDWEESTEMSAKERDDFESNLKTIKADIHNEYDTSGTNEAAKAIAESNYTDADKDYFVSNYTDKNFSSFYSIVRSSKNPNDSIQIVTDMQSLNPDKSRSKTSIDQKEIYMAYDLGWISYEQADEIFRMKNYKDNWETYVGKQKPKK